jgi:serine/threonine protein kinase
MPLSNDIIKQFNAIRDNNPDESTLDNVADVIPIVAIGGWNIVGGKLTIGTKFLAGGSPDVLLQKEREHAKLPGWWNPTGKAIVITGMALGMAYIHERGLIHCDFKPAKVLLDERGRPQIADFGLFRETDIKMAMNNVGTAIYLAPKIS